MGKTNSETLLTKRAIFYGYFKRVVSFIIATIGLFCLMPVASLIILAIKLDDKGPAFFKQLRTGRGGKNFYIYKFRTMRVDNDALDFARENQYTRIGSFLRKTSLDELPQLINIVRGEMCFIGPRPWMVEYFKLMNKEQRHRVDVLPGITGLAQAKGRNSIDIFDKINYDLEYIRHYSLKEDIKVVLLTAETVIAQTGADASKSNLQDELQSLKSQNF